MSDPEMTYINGKPQTARFKSVYKIDLDMVTLKQVEKKEAVAKGCLPHTQASNQLFDTNSTNGKVCILHNQSLGETCRLMPNNNNKKMATWVSPGELILKWSIVEKAQNLLTENPKAFFSDN